MCSSIHTKQPLFRMNARPPHITAPVDAELPVGVTWHPYSDGIWVRYTRERVTFKQSILLSEKKTWQRVFDAAVEWYDNSRAVFPPLTMVEIRQLKRKNNRSGRPGISRTSDGKYWRAQYSDANGKRPAKTFRIDVYGDSEAERLANEWLDEGLAGLPDLPGVRNVGRRNSRQHIKLGDDIFAFEGDEYYRLHREKERDPSIRRAKLEEFVKKHEKLFCEICHFSFSDCYGVLGTNLIEIHHLTPVAEMKSSHKTTLDQLMCVCSNCHLVLHNGDPTINLRLLKHLFSMKRESDETA